MKLVIAIVRPFKLDEIREALTPLGVQGITVTEVKGFGRQKGQTEIYRGAEYHVSFLPKMKIEIAIAADQVDSVVETICRVGQTGKIGDGKIFVLDIERAVRTRPPCERIPHEFRTSSQAPGQDPGCCRDRTPLDAGRGCGSCANHAGARPHCIGACHARARHSGARRRSACCSSGRAGCGKTAGI